MGSLSHRGRLPIFFLALFFLFVGIADAASPKTVKWAGLFENEIVSMDQVYEKLKNNDRFLLVDARSFRSFQEMHIPGAVLPATPEYYEMEEEFRLGRLNKIPEIDPFLKKQMRRYPKDIEIITYCSDDCQASAVLVFKLKKMGYKYARAMEGGVQSWQAKGYPVAAPIAVKTPAEDCSTCAK